MNIEEAATAIYLLRKRRRKKKFWIHSLFITRNTKGLFTTFINDLRQHDDKFFNYTRMSIQSFDELLNTVYESLKGTDLRMRKSVSPEEKLFVTLRYLATGCSFVDLHYAYRLGITTVRERVGEVCVVLWTILKDTCLIQPSKEKWLEIANEFELRANFPNCLGAVDGKHIRVIKPNFSGSVNYNYKHLFSLVLLAVCDADYNFVTINVGADGKERDSLFYKALVNNELALLDDRPLSTLSTEAQPFVFVGDETFGLSERIMRPYCGKKLTTQKRIFNYRLCRARRFIECTFGILANKWRIFHRAINVNRDFAIDIIKAYCVLHNYVRARDGFKFEDTLETPGMGIREVPVGEVGRGNRSSARIRDFFAEYFENEGKLEWQDKYV